jgi:hypothetical protein
MLYASWQKYWIVASELYTVSAKRKKPDVPDLFYLVRMKGLDLLVRSATFC